MQNQKNLYAMENTDMTVEQSLAFVGDSSTYQKRTIFILSITQCCFAFLIMGIPFLFKGPLFLCEDASGQFYVCQEQESCQRGVIIDYMDAPLSLTVRFQLYCGKKYLIALFGSLLFLGQTLSGFIFPQLSARRGRVWCMLVAIGMTVIPIVLAASVQSLILLFFVFLLAGLGQSGFENEAFIYLSEISSENFRNSSQVILNASWGLSQIILAIILQYIEDWRLIFILVIAFPMFISMILMFVYIFESPRYLVAQRMYDQARGVLSKIGIINGRPMFQYRFENEMEEDIKQRQIKRTYKKYLTRQLWIKQQEAGFHDNQETLTALAQNYSYIDLFRYDSLRLLSITLLLLWTFRYQVYFGLAFTMLSFGDNLNDNFVFLAISELVGCLLSVLIKVKFNRIPSLAILIGVSSVSSILIYFPQIPQNCFHLMESCYQKELTVLLAMVVRFSITIFGDVLVTYTTEVYPTVVRSLGFGICISIGKIGSIFMPYIVSWFQYRGINPLIVFGAIGLLPIYSMRFLPETKNKRMDDYIYETELQDKPLIELTEHII